MFQITFLFIQKNTCGTSSVTTSNLPPTAAFRQPCYSPQQGFTFNGPESSAGLVNQKFLVNQSLAGKYKLTEPPSVLCETSPL